MYNLLTVLGTLTITSGNMFALDNNTISVSNSIVIGTSWESYTMCSKEYSDTSIQVPGSTLSISNNTLSLSDVTIGATCYVYTKYSEGESDLRVTNGGALLLSDNTVLWSDVTISNAWVMYVLLTEDSLISFQASCKLAVLNNTVSYTQLTMPTKRIEEINRGAEDLKNN
eukprot:TRINITY_DN60362_c0_g1_i3.p1 TRINITY_DN60362_c0_g1~~TRINITY_DN60362_c0_g1_i3.p1  ORF type:complete len:170 (-),score=9.85 TRINITY_DN60362_c0_g1_i3:79-588(-)